MVMPWLLLAVAAAAVAAAPSSESHAPETTPAPTAASEPALTSIALDLVNQELSETRRLASVLARRVEALDKARDRLLTGASRENDTALRQLLFELRSKPLAMGGEARRLAAAAAAPGGVATQGARRAFSDMFVSGPEIAAPSPVAALVLPVTFSAYASRGTAGRRRAFLQSTASLYCVVTVSAVGEVRVVSAAGAVLARHWVWGPPSGPARDDRLDVEVRLPTVTAAALGGEASPFLAVSGSDGSLVTLELTVFVDGQRAMGRSLMRQAADARAAAQGASSSESNRASGSRSGGGSGSGGAGDGEAAGGPPGSAGDASTAGGEAAAAGEGTHTATCAEAATCRASAEVGADGSTSGAERSAGTASGASGAGSGAGGVGADDSSGESRSKPALPAHASANASGTRPGERGRPSTRHPDAPSGLGMSAVITQAASTWAGADAITWAENRVAAAFRERASQLPWDWCWGAPAAREDAAAAPHSGNSGGGGAPAATAEGAERALPDGRSAPPECDDAGDEPGQAGPQHAGGGAGGAGGGGSGGSGRPAVWFTSLAVYRLRGQTMVAAGDSAGIVVVIDASSGLPEGVSVPSPETHPRISPDLALAEQAAWLQALPAGPRAAARDWMVVWSALGGALPQRCGCAARPSPPPLPAIAAPAPPAPSQWRGVNALTRYAPHLASARGFRVTFASASTLRDTGSICEVPGQALLASGSSAGPLSADIVSLAFDAAEPRFLWAGTRGGDVLVFDTRAPASARGAARRAGSGVCRLVHRFALASLVDPENADEADAAADLATTSLGAAVVETTRGYAVVSALAGTFLFNATGIAAATPRLVTSFATPPAEIQALKAAARLQREAGPGRASAEVLPTLLSLANAGPRGTTDPVAAWVSARSCPSASGEECDAVVRTATLLLPQPVRPAGADVGWMRVPAIGIVVVVAVGFQIWSKGGGGPVLEFLRKLGRLLGLVSGTGGGRSGGPGDKYSAQSLSAEDKAAVADLLRRTQASMGGGGMGGGLGGGLRGAGRGGGTGMAAGFDAMARAAADGGGGRFDRRAAMEEIHLQAEADRLAGVPRGGAFGRRDDHDDMGRGWGADDTPIGEWLPDPDYD